ncbi:MAG: hypothetical protein ACHQD9_02500 [Chitinophagales bacterium]
MNEVKQKETQLRRKINTALIITIVGLLLNGISIIPLRTEISILLATNDSLPKFLQEWLNYVSQGLQETGNQYNFMRYGFDWLGFTHLLIAILFFGALKDPVKNEWVVKWGMIVSLLSIAMALGWEQLRSVPFWWSIIDAMIALLAFVVLWLCNKWIQQLKATLAQ